MRYNLVGAAHGRVERPKPTSYYIIVQEISKLDQVAGVAARLP
jgi:hypothetical protein